MASVKRREMKTVGALVAVMVGACGLLAAEAVSGTAVLVGLLVKGWPAEGARLVMCLTRRGGILEGSDGVE
jgi:hypothetical protein